MHVNFMVKCVRHMGLGSNGCFVIGIALMGSHYRLDIINGVGHSRLDSVVPLVLCTGVYNIWSTNVALQVPRDSANSTRKG